MIFQSKPHQIEAFQFTGNDVKPPKWFAEAYEKGEAFLTLREFKGVRPHIMVMTKSGFHKAFLNDWVCINHSGTLFVLSEQEMKRGFIEVDRTRDVNGAPEKLWITPEAVANTLEDCYEGEGLLYQLIKH